MPRIRKKTSKRGTTHQRAKIKHKIAEGRRKKKKEAKKNPQWKSKKKKDPGIPNEFPYKDQILAEVAESRRQVEEAKRRHKEEKKVAQEGHAMGADNDVENAPTMESSSSKRHRDDDAPLLLNPDLPNLKTVLDKADVVLHVLDARDPASFRLPHIEEIVSTNEHLKLVFVLNKIDLVPREALGAWAKHLRPQHPTFLFRAASTFLPKPPMNHRTAKGKAKEESLGDAIGAEALLDFFRQRAEETQKEILQVAVVGITNTGKSALINSLAHKAVVPIYAPTPSTETWSTTTPRAYEVTLEPPADNKRVNLIDTPGVSLHNDPEQPLADAAALRIRDILRRSRGRVDKLKDPIPAIEYILSRADTTDLMVHYSLPAFSPGDTTAFLAGVARANALLKKRGVPDATQAARMVLRDWMTGRLPFYTEAEQEGEAAPEDMGILEMVATRKERRRAGPGLVRLELPTEKEIRRVELERMFTGDEKPNGYGGGESVGEDGGVDEGVDEDEDDGEYDGEGADEGSDQDEDGGVDEEDDGDEDASGADADIPTSRRGKRKCAMASTKTAPPKKKVAFAAGTQDRQERRRERSNSKLKSTGRSQTQAAKSSKDSARPSKAAATPPKAGVKPQKGGANPISPKDIKKPPAPVKKVPLKKASTAQANDAESDAYDFGQFFE